MTIREVITEKIAKHTGQTEPFDFAWFTINMTGIVVAVCYDLLQADVGRLFLDKKPLGTEKPNPENLRDIIAVINGEDMLRNMILTRQATEFFNWFLDQEEPGPEDEDDGGSPLAWCDMTFILRKWNEYASKASDK